MAGEVHRGSNESFRPAYHFEKDHPLVHWYPSAQLEMLESIRNTMEAVHRSQMLQCDVAHAIKDMAIQIRGLRRDLAKRRKRK